MKVKQLKSGNILHSDGRIYFEEDGIARTVSPYAPDFYENIEEEIKPLVSAFVEKGYLTYSSCSGHQAVKRRFVSIAFPNRISCINFIALARSAYNHFLIKYDIKHGTDYYFVSKENVMFHTNFLNTEIFYRGYKDYYFVEISIGENTPPSLKNMPAILIKKILRNYVTKKLYQAVKSSRFAFYES